MLSLSLIVTVLEAYPSISREDSTAALAKRLQLRVPYRLFWRGLIQNRRDL